MTKELLKQSCKKIFSLVKNNEPDVDDVYLRYEFNSKVPSRIAIVVKRRPKWINVNDALREILKEFVVLYDGIREDGLLGVLVSISSNGNSTRYLRNRLDIWSIKEEDFGTEQSFFSGDQYIQPDSLLACRRESVMSSGKPSSTWVSIAYTHHQHNDVNNLETFLHDPQIRDTNDVELLEVSSLNLVVFDDGRFFDYSDDPDVKLPIINSSGELKNYHSDRLGVFWEDGDTKLVLHSKNNPTFDKYDTDKFIAYDDSDTFFSEVCYIEGDRLYRVISLVTDNSCAEQYVYLYQRT